MTEANVSFAGNLTDDPEVRYTEGGIGHRGADRPRHSGVAYRQVAALQAANHDQGQ